ncbi:MAG TPA: GNAT family protein [Ktedonobacterales bacterium]|nr:GNAT family protein [Ktedonobacterales bacterium]
MTSPTTTTQTQAPPILNMVGEKVALGPRSGDLAPLLARWLNDFEVAVYSGDPLMPNPVEFWQARHETASKDRHSERVEFAIYERATLRPIGVTHWREINPGDRTATYAIIIGEKDCWGKGYGTETTRLMLEYAFAALNLHSVQLTTSAFNERAIRAYLRAGYREVGRRREAHRFGDRVFDEVIMDCLATEFTGHTGRILPPL